MANPGVLGRREAEQYQKKCHSPGKKPFLAIANEENQLKKGRKTPRFSHPLYSREVGEQCREFRESRTLAYVF